MLRMASLDLFLRNAMPPIAIATVAATIQVDFFYFLIVVTEFSDVVECIAASG